MISPMPSPKVPQNMYGTPVPGWCRQWWQSVCPHGVQVVRHAQLGCSPSSVFRGAEDGTEFHAWQLQLRRLLDSAFFLARREADLRPEVVLGACYPSVVRRSAASVLRIRHAVGYFVAPVNVTMSAYS